MRSATEESRAASKFTIAIGNVVAGASSVFQNILTAVVQIWANKGRSFLTTLGIIIAVTAIITVVTFVQGFGTYMTNMLRGYGTQYMVVRPDIRWEAEMLGIGQVQLTMDDVNAVRLDCENVRRLTPFVFVETTVSYGRSSVQQIPTRGVPQEYQAIRNSFVG